MRFVYNTNRSDVITAYQAGSFTRTTVLLTNIQTYADETLVSDYRLTYQPSSNTGRMRLMSITLCEGGGACLPATSFTWENSTTNFAVISNVGGQDGTLDNYRPYIADFNGDGRADVFWDSGRESGDNQSSGNHVLWTNAGGENFQVTTNWLGQDRKTVSWGSHNCKEKHSFFYPFVADFNRDGQTDIWWYNSFCGRKKHGSQYGKSPTIQWFSDGRGGYTIKDGPTKANLLGSGDYYPYAARLLDINADSRLDIAWYDGKTIKTVFLWTTQQDGSIVDGTLSVSSDDTGLPIDIPGIPTDFPGFPIFSYQVGKSFSKTSAIDFNADGFSDILLQKSETKGMQMLLFGNGDNSFRVVAYADASVDNYSPSYADLNGDGQTDILWDRQDKHGRSAGNRILWFSHGDGTFTKLANAGGLDDTLSTKEYRPYLTDFNGDGRLDVFWDAEKDTSARSTGKRVLWLNTGENSFTVLTNPGGQDGTLVDYAPHFGDFNGDGKTDILWDKRSGTDSRSQGQRVLWLSDGVAPDTLKSVRNGLGATVSISYKPLTDGSIYSKGTSTSDPVVDMQGPIYVVSRIARSNGVGGTNAATYRYAGAKLHLDGRGFLGFREMISRDEQTGIEKKSVYEQYYPFTLMKRSETTSLNGQTLSHTSNSYDAEDLGGTRRRVFLTQSESSGADPNGVTLPSTTTAYQYDAFSNATRIEVTTSDGFSKTTTNTYSNDVAQWLLGRLLTADVTSTAPDVASQTPVEDATPDPLDFIDVTDALRNTVYEGRAVVAGVNRVLTASVSGGDARIRKNGSGDWVSSLPVNPGDTLNIRMTSGSAYDSVETATITAGGVTSDWSITVVPRNRTITISENTNDFNLRARHDSLYPPPVAGEATPITVTAVIEPGVIVGSTDTTTPAFDVGLWPDDVAVTLNVRGRIQGAGGDGGPAAKNGSGSTAYIAGKDGGPALYTRNAVTLDVSSGQIWGGGGGGSGGPIKKSNKQAGSGGGGAGQLPGKGGARGNGTSPLNLGQSGTTEAGGQGGQATTSNAFPGTDGGGPGLPGAGANGGKAGAAIDGAGLITQTGTGDIRGPIKLGPGFCDGADVGGYCWYLSGMSESCDAVCSSHGGCNLAGTRDYVGSGGSLENCQSVATSLGLLGEANEGPGSDQGVGCSAINLFGVAAIARVTSPATTCSASTTLMQRICACGN